MVMRWFHQMRLHDELTTIAMGPPMGQMPSQTIWYIDGDEDGHGDPTQAVAPVMLRGYVDSNDDCDDASDIVNPSATEQCNDIDDNCDGDIDEAGVLVLSTYYADRW